MKTKIANRKTNHQTVAQLEHGRLTSLVNSMADGVVAVDEDVKVVLYNGAALNILDINIDIEGKPLADVLKPVDKDGSPIDIKRLVQSVKTPTINRDLLLKYSDDSRINLFLSISPVHMGYGSEGERGYVIMLRDITREKSLEEERDEFISVVSHELRTPIAISEGDISNAQLIAEKDSGDKEVIQALNEAHSQIMFLSDMINDLSTLSRAERGKLTLEVEEFDPRELLLELGESYLKPAADKGLKLNVEVPPSLPLLHTSELYVREVLQNFITNSIKYTEKGWVLLSAKPADGGIEFTVSDSGIGISKQDQKRVFEKFFRSEDYRTRSTGGTGLGLYVTSKLARLLGAKITLSSHLNKGSAFSIMIPDQLKVDNSSKNLPN